MRPALSLAKDMHAMLFIADYHALTTITDADELRRLTYEVAASWLSVGLDPECVTFYRQSDVLETFELFWLLSCVTPKGSMNRSHAYKSIVDGNTRLRRARDVGVNMGLYAYPILMAADVLLFDADFVPVGTDQTQHIEMVRDIARRFNDSFGVILTIPKLLQDKDGEVILGVDGLKMSKSHANTIPLFASSDELRKSLRSYFTDSESATAVSRALVSGELTWGRLKDLTFEAVDADIAPMRQRYAKIRDDTAGLERLLSQGAEKARARAKETMRRVREAVGAGGRR